MSTQKECGLASSAAFIPTKISAGRVPALHEANYLEFGGGAERYQTNMPWNFPQKE